ncbi:MAG: hypothetical protein MUC49_22405 [Raineya sp.]|jgi:hypothetical protein|nr:hypothetical protein [Raineya sp.]
MKYFIFNHKNKFNITFSEEYYYLTIKKITILSASSQTGPEFMERVFHSHPQLKWHSNKKNGGVLEDFVPITPFLPIEKKKTEQEKVWGEVVFKNGIAVPDRNPKKVYVDLELSISWKGNLDKDIEIQIEYE